MFHCISRGKIPYNALQIYLIFYALLFLSVAASRMAVGISRIIDNIWLTSIFRSAARQHMRADARKTRVAANLITFDRRCKLFSPSRKFNVPETRQRACEKRDTTRTVMYVVMNCLTSRCNATAVPYEPVEKKRTTRMRKSF